MNNNLTFTSQEWFEKIPKEYNVLLWSSEGWNKDNFNYNFYEEKIDKNEFIERLINSTVKCDSSFIDYVKKWKKE